MRKKKIAIINFGAHGHVNPTLELSKALVQKGHTVDYLITRHFEPMIRATGARVFPYDSSIQQVTPNTDVENSLGRTDIREVARNVSTASRIVDHAAARRSVAMRAIDMFPAVVEYCEAEKPDVLLFEKLCWSAVVCARRFGMPSAMLHSTYCGNELQPGLNPVFEIPQEPVERAELEKTIARFLDSHPESPNSLQEVFADHDTCNVVFMSKQFHPLGTQFNGRYHFVGAQIPRLEKHKTNSKTLYISLGTIFGMNKPWFYRECIDAFAETEWNVVMAVGVFHSPDSFGPLPPNIKVVQYADQHDVLCRASAFVTHGGMGSVQEAIWLEVPMVVSPQDYDQFASARRISELKCGVTVSGERPALGGALVDAVASVTENEEIQTNLHIQKRHSEESGGVQRAASIVESLMR